MCLPCFGFDLVFVFLTFGLVRFLFVCQTSECLSAANWSVTMVSPLGFGYSIVAIYRKSKLVAVRLKGCEAYTRTCAIEQTRTVSCLLCEFCFQAPHFQRRSSVVASMSRVSIRSSQCLSRPSRGSESDGLALGHLAQSCRVPPGVEDFSAPIRCHAWLRSELLNCRFPMFSSWVWGF